MARHDLSLVVFLMPSSPFTLVVRFRSSHTYISGRHVEVLALCPTIAHARDQGVKIGTREFPLG